MKVSTSKPFQIVYSIYQHEYLGYLVESFVVQKDPHGKLTLQNQIISSANAAEFSAGLDPNDFEIIKLVDTIQHDYVVRKFNRSKLTPAEFLFKIYKSEQADKILQDQINIYLEKKKSKIFSLMKGKKLFEMGNDGEPTWKQIEVVEKKAVVTFHFSRNSIDTQYFPIITLSGQKVEFQFRGAYLPCKTPSWLIANDKLYGFTAEIDGNKLLPFLNKKAISVSRKLEDTYYRKFVAPLVASFDVKASGFEIITQKLSLVPVLNFSEILMAETVSSYDEEADIENYDPLNEHIAFELSFNYGNFTFKADSIVPVSVEVDEKSGNYYFYRIPRQMESEKKYVAYLKNIGLELLDGTTTLQKLKAFTWLNQNKQALEDIGFRLEQAKSKEKKYFIGKSSISFEIRESIDWFDIYALIRFGEFEIPFNELRRIVMLKGNEITLPNGEIAVIPESWLIEYSELFAFVEDAKTNNSHTAYHLKKYHLALVKELEKGNLARVSMSQKLEKLRNFQDIDDEPVPEKFIGSLRPYQKAGYNWLHFLNKYHFGGCLADDMGLGKTIQTLALLQSVKESGQSNASLLIMPTSLVYNWEIEASRFTPGLKVLVYTGTNREKDIAMFNEYDLVLTSYGIVRLDVDLLAGFYFHYIILDESQAIKNPNSNISKSVRKLKSRFRLILTGTPLENSTLDLWSQMTFVNPGLLGTQSFFKNEFLTPIEKKKDEDKTRKLNAIIKPFILRRHKSQVAQELPEKVESIKYCSMTPDQEKHYEEAKSFFRNKILDTIETYGVKKSHFILLQGLTKLRQIANHPKMVDENYEGDSGKLEDVTSMIHNATSEGHKILVFSQFVKHLTIIGNYLKQNHITFAYLDGSTKDREGEVNSFQQDESVGIFLISLKAGGLGLNLTKADYVFLLDPWWNPAVEQQAIDRAHRIGQENKVFTYKFITKDTVEEKIISLQNHKLKLASDLITTDESFFKELTAEDIRALLD
ncbi:MAG TPA: DEAD/DEAH box helicase [Cyclobacteriaceae bacterium]|nr:DEAD/DEAH box helicase [Cyclobacteriaceae bacterium]